MAPSLARASRRRGGDRVLERERFVEIDETESTLEEEETERERLRGASTLGSAEGRLRPVNEAFDLIMSFVEALCAKSALEWFVGWFEASLGRVLTLALHPSEHHW